MPSLHTLWFAWILIVSPAGDPQLHTRLVHDQLGCDEGIVLLHNQYKDQIVLRDGCVSMPLIVDGDA